MSPMSMQFISWSASLTVMACIAILGHAAPSMSRRELFFAITVPASFRESEAGQRVLAGYRRRLWLHSFLAMGTAAVLLALHQRLLVPLALGWQMAGLTLAYVRARQETAPHAVPPTTRREAALVPRPLVLPGGLVGVGLPLGLLGMAALYLNKHWDELPVPFPVHWGLEGADRWVERTPLAVYGPLLAGAGVCLMMVGLMIGIPRLARPVHVQGPEAESDAARLRLVLYVLLGCEYLLAISASLLSLFPLLSDAARNKGTILLFVMPLGLILALLLLIGRSLDRLRAPPDSRRGTETVGDRTADSHWRGGIFYVNRDDPALFVEKRMGIGYTLNFGRPAAWVLLGLLVLLPLGIHFLLFLVALLAPR